VSEGEDLIFKDYNNSAATLSQQPATAGWEGWEGWEAWLRAHLDNERASLIEMLARSMGEVISEERATARKERESGLLELKSEISELLDGVANNMGRTVAELRKEWQQEVKQLRVEVEARERAQAENRSYTAGLRKDLAAVHQELERRRADEYMAAHTARLDRLETQMKMLLSVVANVVDLPRGV